MNYPLPKILINKEKQKRRQQIAKTAAPVIVLAALLTLLAVLVLLTLNAPVAASDQQTGVSAIPKQASSTFKVYEIIDEQVRHITAYNAGDPNQTDDSPCIAARGDNICTLLAQGEKICAANFVPYGTRLYIDGWGECIVLDRMAKRFGEYVDVAMTADEIIEAKSFNKFLNVKILAER